VGPLATNDEPHSWDLCEEHAGRITAPKGWELVRYAGGFTAGEPVEDDLTALAEAVREAGRGDVRRRFSPSSGDQFSSPVSPITTRTGRRGHLRVLPDPTD